MVVCRGVEGGCGFREFKGSVVSWVVLSVFGRENICALGSC